MESSATLIDGPQTARFACGEMVSRVEASMTLSMGIDFRIHFRVASLSL